MSFCSLTKGITPKICRLCVSVIINKRSFEPCMCLDLVIDRCYLALFSALVRTKLGAFSIIIIIIVYIYHALINALNAHTIHINLKMKFYTHVEYILKSSFVALYVHRNSMAY